MLLEIAESTIGNFNHLNQNLMPHFSEMLEYGIILPAEQLPGYYYLAKSTPF